MSYHLEHSFKAEKEFRQLVKRNDKNVLRKIAILLKELEEHPSTGTGQVEKLKHKYTGFWSRRINLEHRIVYKIDEEEKIVTIYAYKGHY